MNLLELFNSDVKLNEPSRNSDHSFEIEQEVGGRNILFIAMAVNHGEDDGDWRIDFAEHLDADVDEPFVNNRTGKGKEFEVFNFVIACAQEFVKQKNPQVIRLKSDKSEPTREKLYLRMAKRFSADWDITQKSSSRYHEIIMTRKDSK
jgi:hypothetical protein